MVSYVKSLMHTKSWRALQNENSKRSKTKGRVFNSSWKDEFLMIELPKKGGMICLECEFEMLNLTCLECGDLIQVMKLYNANSHYKKHSVHIYKLHFSLVCKYTGYYYFIF